MTVGRQFKLLLWKNYILKKRFIVSTFVEVFVPLLFVAILITLRLKSKPVKKSAIRYEPIPVDDLPLTLTGNFPPYYFWLVYVPSKSDVVKTIVERVEQSFHLHFNVKGYLTNKDFEGNYSYRTLAAIIFNHIFKDRSEPLPLKVDYNLRFSSHQRFSYYDNLEQMKEVFDGWNTLLLFPISLLTGPRQPMAHDGGLPGYFREGFLAVQHAVNKEIIHYHMNDSMTQEFKKINILLKRFPYPSYVQDPFISIIENNLSLLIMLSFLCTSIFIIRSIVQEKERKLKEYMHVMGLNNWLHWSAWFFIYLFFFLIVITIMTFLFSLKVGNNVAVLTKSDPTLVFFFLLCFSFATISFSFMISVFFNKANVAVATGGILYFFSYLPIFYINFNFFSMTHKMKLASCLLSNVAMALGILFIVRLEGQGVGIQWRHVLKISVSEKFGFGEVLIMLLIDSIIYGLVTWYVEAVFPGDYGIPQPWYFFVMPSYWFGITHKISKIEELENDLEKTSKSPYIQEEPTGLVAGIRICNLYKVFKVGSKIREAVKNLTLNMYEGQITVLLGHNGAGKTTTLSILTGLFPATSGEAYLCGYEVSQDISQIRKSLGLCPQHDILFDYMTVAEHLSFYVQMKGVCDEDCSDEINYILDILNLENKRHTISKSLSGGMKRKVSIGIALIGGSKVVMLDEPTSGMDPVSRRAMWELLQQQKSNRTILMTTHFMDEADLLGDRIAIMAKGELQCCGSSLFLKQKYGAGYHMIIVKEPHCNINDIKNLVYEYIPNASLESSMGAELSFILPKDNINRFEALFEELEEKQVKLGISSFGASVTTMEEVFLRVSKLVDSSLDLKAIHLPSVHCQSVLKVRKSLDLSDSLMGNHPDMKYNIKFSLHCQQFYAMLVKKILFNWRNWKMFLGQTIIPLVFVTFIIKSFNSNLEARKSPLLRLTLRQYGRTTVPFFISKTSRLHPRLSDHISNTIQDEGQVPLEIIDSIEDFLISKASEESDTFNENFLVATSFQDQEDKTIITALFNNQAFHAAPIALSIVDNILYKLYFGPRASITVSNHPQPMQRFKSASDRLYQGPKGHFLAVSLLFGLAFVVSSFAVLVVNEQDLRSKHLQFVSGVYFVHFWLSSLLWDLLIFLFTSFLLLLVLKIMDEKAYIHEDHPVATMLMLILYAWSVIPCTYLMSFFFSGAAAGCAKLIIMNIITGIFPFLFISILGEKELGFNTVANVLDTICLLLPNYCLGMAFSNLYYNYEFQRFCEALTIKMERCRKINPGFVPQDNIYAWESLGIGMYLTAMAVCGFIFLLMLFFIETKYFQKLKIFINKIFTKENLAQVCAVPSVTFRDQDVEEERNKILTSLPELLLTTPLIAKELIKVYEQRKKNVLAVNKISLTVQKGECFGLLGFNGAGKTSTFKMLTGESRITSGDAFINGKSIVNDFKVLQRQIGYCPQFDALLDHMTGREILTMYARIWGIPEDQIKWCVENIMYKVLLDAYADKTIRTYSGGNKRKLSTGIALMGNPSIVFLDEPSTGVDPVARRLLWNAVTQARENGRAIVITSHSMEECEALCTRLAIMVNGHFKCLGSPQHLKSKFGSGYTLLAKVKRSTDEEEMMRIEAFKIFVTETFTGSILQEEHQGMVHYHLPKENLKWSKVFGILEEVREKYVLDDYSISQVSLEQVFLSFAHLQTSVADDVN